METNMRDLNTKPIFVYVLTAGYRGLHETEADAVRCLILGEGDPEATGISLEEQAEIRAELPDDITGAMICSGDSLRDPGALADMLDKDPDSRLVIVDADIMALRHDRSSEEYALMTESLRRAKNEGLDSWSWARAAISAE